MLTSILISLAGCTRSDDRPSPAPSADARAMALSTLPFAELELPPDSRPGHVPPPATIPLDGPWRYVGSTRKQMHKYAIEIPIRPRGLFFQKPQPGMRLQTRDGAEVAYGRSGHSVQPMWSHDRRELIVYVPERNGPPEPGDYVLSYPKATDREASLNLAWARTNHRGITGDERPATPEEFVWTEIQDDWDNRRGLLLPAPGTAAWDVELPPAAELHFVSGLVEPEIKVGSASDGASFSVEIEREGAVEVVKTDTVAVRAFEPQRVDLSKWSGQRVRLRIRTSPGEAGNADYDYVFLAEPAIASRKADPVRVVMVFVDTLRPDHMSLYGYDRDTTAAIDPLAARAAVFSTARSVAPWTLPSARTIVTGRHPEFYGIAPTLQGILGQQGWATGFIAGNVYLSVNFGMTRDWDFHRVGLWPLAEEATDDALRWLEEHDGRDALLQVHYMGTHLPYVEPPSYRHRYAGEPAGGLREEFHLSDVRRVRAEGSPETQTYIRDRYDNNVRYVTDQVRRIVDVLDDNDILLLYADHGEEFWDHDGFEHGHTLYEELLHVPLIIDGPGIEGRRVDAPVSLLDLTPTVLDLVGVQPPGPLDGRSLAPLLRGEPGADAPFRARDLAFGRPLYGSERWGVLHGDEKWTTTEGREALYDLAADPGEKKDLLRAPGAPDPSGYRAALGAALGREVGEGYRLSPTNHRGGPPIPGLWALCTVPGGFHQAWKADDPLQSSEATVRRIEDRDEIAARLARYGITDHALPPEGAGAAEVCWHAGLFGSREVYLVPERPLAEVGHEMTCSARLGDRVGTFRIPADRDPTMAGPRMPLASLSLDARTLSWQFGIAPVPDERTLELSGRDDETNEMLEAIGYTDPEAPKDGPGGAPKAPPPDAPDGPEDAAALILRQCVPPETR